MNESGDNMDDSVTETARCTETLGTTLTEEAQRVIGELRARARQEEQEPEIVFDVKDVSVFYGEFRAVRDVSLPIRRNEITALIGPSGCGKTTFLRCLNRMNDLIDGARVEGQVRYHGVDLYDRRVDPVEVRRRIGMVFQKPNPFPKSIYDNVAFGPKIAGYKGNMDELVEEALQQGRAVGRGQGQAEGLGDRAVRRPAAAPLHRAGDRRPSPT